MIADLLDLVAPSAVPSAPPAVKIARGGTASAAGGFGADLLAALGGPALPDPLTASLTAIDVHLSAAPMLSTCRLSFLPQPDFPALAPGDALSVELGFGTHLKTVFAGTITAIGVRAAAIEILLATPAAALARMRRNSGYEHQSFSALLKLWANEAGLHTGDIEAGPDYAFLAVDDRHSLWDWMARLARHAGVPVWIAADGRLHAHAPRGQPLGRWRWGEDIVALEAVARDPAITAARMVGEGSAGRQGSEAWAWLAKDAQGVSASAALPGTATGAGASVQQDGALRDLAALTGAASAQASGAAQLTDGVRVRVPGAPALDVAAKFELSGCPGGYGDGVWAVREVRHRFAIGQGFTTDLTGVAG